MFQILIFKLFDPLYGKKSRKMDFGHWILGFDIYLEFGAWNLTFLNTSIPGIVSLMIIFLLGIVPLSFISGLQRRTDTPEEKPIL